MNYKKNVPKSTQATILCNEFEYYRFKITATSSMEPASYKKTIQQI